MQARVRPHCTARGKVLYSLFGVIEPNYSNLGYALKFWWYQTALAKQIGYQLFFASVYNEIALKLLKKIGARVLETRRIGEDGPEMSLVVINIQESPSF